MGAQHEFGRAFADHDAGCHRVARGHRGHDRGVRNTQALHPVDTERAVDHGHRVAPHLGRAAACRAAAPGRAAVTPAERRDSGDSFRRARRNSRASPAPARERGRGAAAGARPRGRHPAGPGRVGLDADDGGGAAEPCVLRADAGGARAGVALRIGVARLPAAARGGRGVDRDRRRSRGAPRTRAHRCTGEHRRGERR
jgi:hypothetical protein